MKHSVIITTPTAETPALSDGERLEGNEQGYGSVDRFVLNEDGLATERFTYFDSLPLLLTLVRRPRTWPRFTRSRIRQMRH
jgi:hypothetical protein